MDGDGYYGGGVNYNTNLLVRVSEIFPDTYPVVINIPLVHIFMHVSIRLVLSEADKAASFAIYL